MKLERVRSFLNEKTSSINKNFQLAELTGTARRVHRLRGRYYIMSATHN